MPEAPQDGRQRDNLLGQGIGKKHEDQGNRREKCTQDLDLIFQAGDQEDPDDHPGKKGEGFMEIGDRGMTCFRISCDESKGMRGKSNQERL